MMTCNVFYIFKDISKNVTKLMNIQFAAYWEK